MDAARTLAPLALTALLLAGCAGSTTTPTTNPAGDQNAMVDISNFNFNPTTLNIHKGSSVMWMNAPGAATHTVTFDGGPDSGDIAAGHDYTHTFNDVGSFTYHCKYHASMTGKVTVTA
jgi:plastocyanin